MKTTDFTEPNLQVEGGMTVKYYLAGGQRIATLAPGASAGVRTPNNNVSYLLSDHLGSTSLTTNSAGTVTSEMRYTACPLRSPAGVLREGETRFTSGTSPSNYRFTGQRVNRMQAACSPNGDPLPALFCQLPMRRVRPVRILAFNNTSGCNDRPVPFQTFARLALRQPERPNQKHRHLCAGDGGLGTVVA
jgi:hypothetical protein